MNFNTTSGRLADFAMPACGTDLVASARVRRDVTHAAAIKTVSPGAPAWSPPT